MKHKIASSLLQNRVNVTLVGAGGSGSQMLSALAKLNHALRALNHEGLDVTVWDDDIVTRANIGRQLFYPSDEGLPKAVVLVHRVNCTFGLDWSACTRRYVGERIFGTHLVITCVDTAQARRQIHECFTSHNTKGISNPDYWLDMGNQAKRGQVFLTQPGRLKDSSPHGREANSLKLPTLADVLPEMLDESIPEDDTPSCSLAEALEKQDLFINQAIVTWASHLLWCLFRNGGLDVHGYWINLETGFVTPVPVPQGANR